VPTASRRDGSGQMPSWIGDRAAVERATPTIVYTLRQALTRNGDGSGSGPLARALDLLAQ
jgi:hypothetical protein